ncbi:MAG TPA: hypothetical protein VFZ59_18050 [Verrucomicrobiae bacterium]|nr:hypothetical protein [Verrucomicrobiae bacterium]
MVQIKTYTIADLRQRLACGTWFEGNPIPVTRERVWSQVNNPRADDADVALLVATENEMVIAHLGIVPDFVFAGGQKLKIGWLTAWWANPDRKYSGTGMMLMMRAMGFYKAGVGASGFSNDAKAVYSATKRFKTVQELRGMTAFARFDLANLLPKRLPVLAKVRWLLAGADALANGLVLLRQCLWRRGNALPADVKIEYVPALDAEANAFLEQHAENQLSRRGSREVNWIANHSWMTIAPLLPPPSFRFDTTARTHRNLLLKVRREQRLVAVLHLSMIDDHLILPTCCHDQEAELTARIIGNHLVAMRLKRITTFRRDLLECFERSGFPWVARKERVRPWILSGPAGEIARVGVQDGDGDCAFTV